MTKYKVLFATSNKGKLSEAKLFAEQNNVTLLSPEDLGIHLDIEETGTTYEENSYLKAHAYAELLKDKNVITIADDSGIEIPILNNSPGIYSRRWNGHEMTDQEIIEYCMNQLKGKTGKERDANFIAVIALILPGKPVKYFREKMECRIIENPKPGVPVVEGLPFRSLVLIPELNKMIYEIHGTTIESRGGYMTHREKALQKAFQYIANLEN